MKKKILMIISIVVIALPANAQIVIIPKVGICISEVIFGGRNLSFASNSEPNSKKLGLQLGIAAEIGINSKFAIQPELLFIQKGFHRVYSSGSSRPIDWNYLEIPVLAKVKYASGNFKFYGIVGPSMGIALGASIRGRNVNAPIGSNVGNLKRTDFGLQFGVGVMFKNFVFDLRYGFGLTNNRVTASGDESTYTNRAIGITVGYAIPLRDR